MATNTLGEWSDGDDDWIWEIDESTFLPETKATNTLGEWSDGDDDWIWEIDESTFLPETTTTNTLGEFSDGEDDWSNSEDDDLIRNINEDEVLRGLNGDGDLIRNINEEDSLSNPSRDDLSYDLEGEQTGRGEKRKSDEQLLPVESGEDYYTIETKKKHHSKKFDLTATDHVVRFNNVLHDVDLLQSYERTQAIFHHLLADVTRDMGKKDQNPKMTSFITCVVHITHVVHEDDVLTLRGHVRMTFNVDVRGVFIAFNPCKTHKKSVHFKKTRVFQKNPYFFKKPEFFQKPKNP